MGYESPLTAAKINSISEITGMTVPLQMQRSGSLVLQPPRSKFMINDILGGNGKIRSNADDDERTPSPQPRDLSLPPNALHHRHQQHLHHHHHHQQNDDSDDEHSDSSMLDDHSICSGKHNFPKQPTIETFLILTKSRTLKKNLRNWR